MTPFVRSLVAGAAAVVVPFFVSAQNYPVKPIRIISSIPLGGSGDIAMRMAAAKMSESLGRTVVVETNGAGGGMVAARMVAKSPADGYTLFHSSSGPLAGSVFLSKDPGYDPIRDFTPISLVSYAPSLLVVNASVPAGTVKELVDYARRNPGKLSYASNGVGSYFHLTGETFKNAAGIDILHVPYTGGNMSLPLNDLLSGRIDVFFPTVTLAGAHLGGGKMKPLAVLGESRLKRLPDLPAIAEAFPAFKPVPSWFALVGPLALPQAIVARLHGEIVKALADSQLSTRMSDLGMLPVGSTPEALTTVMRQTMDLTGKAVKELGIQPQ